MKAIIFILAVFSFRISFCQTKNIEKLVIDSIVANIDNDHNLQGHVFKIQALKKVLHFIDYRYLANKTAIVKIDRRFKNRGDSVYQLFYFRNNKLIYCTETIISYYNQHNVQDTMTWSGSFYFSDGKLIDYVTLGHGKSETEEWDPEADMLICCKEARNDILRFSGRKNGG